MPEYLPYPYPIKNIKGAEAFGGKAVEYRLPVAGTKTSDKMRDRSGVPSNEMFEYQVRAVDGDGNTNGLNCTGKANGVH